MKTSEQINEISKALVEAQKNMGSALKDSKNPFYKSKYADLNAVREACLPALNNAKITVLQPTVQVEGRAFVETVLLHESGQFLASLTEIITAKNNDPQAHGSGISYARRYGLQSFVNLGAEDDDGERAMGREEEVKPKKSLLEVVQEKHTKVETNKEVVEPQKKKTVAFKPKPKVQAEPTPAEDLDL